uniref:Uncharacterized protein n=1 Tax=Arundo donax TaxID=35708 RepID=A0A0A8XSF1_ARUDO
MLAAAICAAYVPPFVISFGIFCSQYPVMFVYFAFVSKEHFH